MIVTEPEKPRSRVQEMIEALAAILDIVLPRTPAGKSPPGAERVPAFTTAALNPRAVVEAVRTFAATCQAFAEGRAPRAQIRIEAFTSLEEMAALDTVRIEVDRLLRAVGVEQPTMSELHCATERYAVMLHRATERYAVMLFRILEAEKAHVQRMTDERKTCPECGYAFFAIPSIQYGGCPSCALEKLESAVDESLPDIDIDGEGGEGNRVERIEWAGGEIDRLQARVAELEKTIADWTATHTRTIP